MDKYQEISNELDAIEKEFLTKTDFLAVLKNMVDAAENGTPLNKVKKIKDFEQKGILVRSAYDMTEIFAKVKSSNLSKDQKHELFERLRRNQIAISSVIEPGCYSKEDFEQKKEG